MTGLAESYGRREIKPLAIALVTLVAYLVARGMIGIVKYILVGFFHFTEGVVGDVVGWLPGAGKWVKGKIEKAEQRAVGSLGEVAGRLDARIADAFHALADQVFSIGRGLFELAWGLDQIVNWLVHGVKVAVLGDHVSTITRKTKVYESAQKRLQAQQAATQKAITHPTVGPIAGAIQAGVKPAAARSTYIDTHELPGLRSRTRTRENTLQGEIEALRERTKALERGASHTWKWLRSHPWTAATTAFVGAVAIAMRRLGLGWLRCSNVGKAGKAVCRMNPRSLEDLLALTVAVVGSISIVTFAKELQAVVDEAATDIHRLIREK